MTHLKQQVFNSARVYLLWRRSPGSRSALRLSIVNSEGKPIPARYVGEQHVREDLGRIPTAQDWLSQIKPQRWMYGQRLHDETSAQEEILA